MASLDERLAELCGLVRQLLERLDKHIEAEARWREERQAAEIAWRHSQAEREIALAIREVNRT